MVWLAAALVSAQLEASPGQSAPEVDDPEQFAYPVDVSPAVAPGAAQPTLSSAQFEQLVQMLQLQPQPVSLSSEKVKNEFWYVMSLGLLIPLSLLVVLSFLRRGEHTAADIVSASGLTLIIFGTIILVLVVNTSEQLTAAIGVLAAIAGYLFRSAQDDVKAGREKAARQATAQASQEPTS